MGKAVEGVSRGRGAAREEENGAPQGWPGAKYKTGEAQGREAPCWTLSSTNMRSRDSGPHSSGSRVTDRQSESSNPAPTGSEGPSPPPPAPLPPKVAFTAGALSPRTDRPSRGPENVSLPSPKDAWCGEGRPLWEGGRKGTVVWGLGRVT